MMNKSMNTILYGPPGTGKTYKTVEDALVILNEDLDSFESREEVKQKFAEYQKANRIFFTTFHQNMAYEDFIEGIKPLEPQEDDEFLQYEVQDGLFMQACVQATFDYIQSNFKGEETVEKLLDFNDLFDELVEEVSNAGSKNFKAKRGGEVIATVTSYGNFSIKHIEGEKLYTVSRNRLSKLYEAYPNPDEVKNINRDFRKIIGGSNATAYWSVLNAIVELKNSKKETGNKELAAQEELSYEDKRKIVKAYWEKKEFKVLEEDYSQPYVFIIDEINRGNVAQIFGELITLLEEDKRMGKMETIYAELPYSKGAFAIPPNLYLIGTMNTADRSVEALDTALRRRFSFEYLGPEPDLLEPTEDGINLPEMLSVINNRLEILKDPDHTLGHAWFWEVKNIEQLKKVFKDKVLPLLQEYFYNDYEKLGLVLGDTFFSEHKQVDADIFASFNGGTGLAGQYDQAWQYKLKPVKDLTIVDFKTLEQQKTEPETNEEE
jgi:5-methylcytosine-specific restriction endonuclease McrBC GTP-binding regulatory subunit McrB